MQQKVIKKICFLSDFASAFQVINYIGAFQFLIGEKIGGIQGEIE